MVFNRLIFIFSLLGLAVSIFLAYEYSQPTINCPVFGGGCDSVRLSNYSSLFGVSLPYWGILFYATLIVSCIIFTLKPFNYICLLGRLFLIAFGFVFGVYLTFLEAFVIKAFCMWCLISFGVSIALLIVGSLELKKRNEIGI